MSRLIETSARNPTAVILLLLALGLVLALAAIGRVPLSYSVRNLTVRWKTTLLTALAFTLVISLLTVMLAFVNGMQRLTEGTGQPGNVLILADGATDEVFSNLNPSDLIEIESLGQIEGESAIVYENGRPLASRETYLVVNQPILNTGQQPPKRRFLQLRGLDDPLLAARVHDLQVLPGGTWFSEAGVEELPPKPGTSGLAETAVQAVLGEGIARELGRDRTSAELASARNRQRLDVGDTFILGNRTWIVVGIMQSSGSTFSSEIWAKRSLMASLFGKNTYTTMVVRTRDAQRARLLKEFLKDYKKVAVAAQVETEYYASLSDTNKQFLYAIGFVTVVMSIGGIFGVMNTMFAAISQRIKDIGVLRLLGFARGQILVSFLLESLLIALVGGLVGCLLGSLCDGWTATSIIGSHTGGGKLVVLRLTVDAPIFAVGIILTLAMGAIGGLVPSLSAMRLTALETLR